MYPCNALSDLISQRGPVVSRFDLNQPIFGSQSRRIYLILCAIFDILFPPFRLLAALAPASPRLVSGGPLAFLTGFVTFTVASFVLGALYGISWGFWSRRLR